MKKTLIRIIMVLAVLTVGTSVSAQGLWNWQKWGHERRGHNDATYSLRLGISGMPSAIGERFTDGAIRYGYNEIYPERLHVGDAYAGYMGNVMSTGVISAELVWNPSKRFNFSGNLAVCPVWAGTFDGVTDARLNTKAGCTVVVMPEVRLMYCNTRTVRAYSALGLGLGMYPGFSKAEFFIPEIQFNIAGIEIGRKWFGFGEFGAGTIFTGVRVGVGYRFTSIRSIL